jgi:hypothetical protein
MSHTDGKYIAGKIKSFKITSADDRQTIYNFLKRITIYSFILILLFPIILFGSIPFLELIFPGFGVVISLVITSTIIIFFRIWYDHMIKKITTGLDKFISRRKLSEIKFSWKMWLLGFFGAFLIVLEGVIAHSGVTYLINSLK